LLAKFSSKFYICGVLSLNMGFIEKIKCFLGGHEWEKFMGPKNIGGGKFSQNYKCKKCKKIKEKIN